MNTLKTFLHVIFLLMLFHTAQAQTAEELNKRAEKILTTDPEKAHTYLLEAHHKSQSDDVTEKILMNIAIVKRVQGEYRESIRLSAELLKNTASEDLKASAHNNLGAAHKRTGENEQAIQHYISALSIYEKTGNLKDAATVENNIGLLYQALEELDKAKEYHERALTHFSSINNQEGISKSYNMLGIVRANQEDMEGALDFFRKSYTIEKLLNNKVGISEAVNNIGGIYYYMGQPDSALVYFEKSLQIDRENKDFSNLADGFNNIAEVYISAGDFKIAKQYLDSSIYYSQTYHYANAYLLSLEMYSHLYELENNLSLSIDYLKKYHAAKDSIATTSNRENINELEKKYQTEKKEMAYREEVIKNKNKTLLLLVLIGAIVILIILIVLIIQRRKMDRQESTILLLKNLEAERTRIARDLHDNLGAELTLISSKLDMKAFRTTNEADKKDLADIREISTNANFVLRETIWSIHKQELTIDELYQKAEEYTSRVFGGKEVRVSVVAFDKATVLSPALALHLFRIIQESVNNAAKYSGCTELMVSISKSKVEITDNGKGFDSAQVQKGYGIQNIEQRVNELNGAISIESEPGKGTRVTVKLTSDTPDKL